jgi:hypothetical protein
VEEAAQFMTAKKGEGDRKGPGIGTILFFFFFCGTGAWTQDLHLEPLHQPYFCEEFLERGSHELFAQAGFNLRSS